jgi:hypothetical protein
MRGAQQEPVEGLVPAERVGLLGRRQRGRVVPGRRLEREAQHGERAPDRVEVGRDRRAVLGDLRRLVADRAVDRAVQVVDPPHRAEVDELELLLHLDHVRRLEVAVEQAPVVQVAERAQDLQHVRDRVGEWQRLGVPGLAQPPPQHVLERLAADVLHHDVADEPPGRRVGVLHEVDDLDDVRVVDADEEAPLGLGGGERLGVHRVEQALEHHPPAVEVAVRGEVDPAEAAVREAALHLVLPGDEVALAQLRGEREPGAAVRAEPLGAAGPVAPGAADRLAARRVVAVPLLLRHLRVAHHHLRRVPVRHRRHLDQAGAEQAAPRPGARTGPPGAGGPGAGRGERGRRERLRSDRRGRVRRRRRRRGRERRRAAAGGRARALGGREGVHGRSEVGPAAVRGGRRGAAALRGGRGGAAVRAAGGGGLDGLRRWCHAAHVAVAVLHRSGAAGIGAPHVHQSAPISRSARW